MTITDGAKSGLMDELSAIVNAQEITMRCYHHQVLVHTADRNRYVEEILTDLSKSPRGLYKLAFIQI